MSITPFDQWFSSDWNRMLHNVPPDTTIQSSGFSIHTASWDRRTAFLLWDALGRPRAAWVEQMAPLYDKSAAAVAPPLDLLADDPPTPVNTLIMDLLS